MKTLRLPVRTAGKAYLIGAGPGSADLITVRGLKLLRQAHVVIYDRLIAQELLEEVHPEAECIFAGKAAGHHSLRQEQINDLLVMHVQKGKQVVRLKGGDPFVFGRGGEEAQALHHAGLDYEIVPGISSALAAPAYAGIPLTQRGLSTAFAVVTGHECSGKQASTTDWAALARIPTLVVLMGLGHIQEITDRLLAEGRDAATPTAVISAGTTEQQRTVHASLAELPAVAAQADLPTPATIVIGEVAALGAQLAWFIPESQAAAFMPMHPTAPEHRLRVAVAG